MGNIQTVTFTLIIRINKEENFKRSDNKSKFENCAVLSIISISFLSDIAISLALMKIYGNSNRFHESAGNLK